MGKLGLKTFDFFIIILGAFVIYGASFLIKTSSRDGKKFVVISAPEDDFIFPLEEDGVFYIPGVIGKSVIKIFNNKAFFYDSPCPSKSCTYMDEISEVGEWSACLPNKVFIRIEKDFSSDSDLDGISK